MKGWQAAAKLIQVNPNSTSLFNKNSKATLTLDPNGKLFQKLVKENDPSSQSLLNKEINNRSNSNHPSQFENHSDLSPTKSHLFSYSSPPTPPTKNYFLSSPDQLSRNSSKRLYASDFHTSNDDQSPTHTYRSHKDISYKYEKKDTHSYRSRTYFPPPPSPPRNLARSISYQSYDVSSYPNSKHSTRHEVSNSTLKLRPSPPPPPLPPPPLSPYSRSRQNLSRDSALSSPYLTKSFSVPSLNRKTSYTLPSVSTASLTSSKSPHSSNKNTTSHILMSDTLSSSPLNISIKAPLWNPRQFYVIIICHP